MNAAQATAKTNSFEIKCYAMLDRVGIVYEKQKLIGDKFCVDAFSETLGLVIQFDGDYWHGNPDKFPIPSARQQKRIKLDASQDAYMRACGYDVLRIWESDAKKHPDDIITRLRISAELAEALYV